MFFGRRLNDRIEDIVTNLLIGTAWRSLSLSDRLFLARDLLARSETNHHDEELVSYQKTVNLMIRGITFASSFLKDAIRHRTDMNDPDGVLYRLIDAHHGKTPEAGRLVDDVLEYLGPDLGEGEKSARTNE